MSDSQAESAVQSIARVINPPNFLKQKAKMAPGLLDELLERADKMVAALQGEFEAGTEIRIRKLVQIFAERWAFPGTREDAVRDLRRLCHDIKGEAGTFGYPLLGDIADLFRDYLRETPVETQRREAIKGYIDTFQVVWMQKIQGEGGELGRQLIASLMKLNEKSQATATV
jgi:HPt (histidine-containing phosphotransfer) domain-containing protein